MSEVYQVKDLAQSKLYRIALITYLISNILAKLWQKFTENGNGKDNGQQYFIL